MEHRTHTAECHPNTRPPSLGHFGTQRAKQGLNIAPGDMSLFRMISRHMNTFRIPNSALRIRMIRCSVRVAGAR